MIPLSVDVPMKRLPWANWVLIIATVAVSLAVPHVKERVESIPGTQPGSLPRTVVHEEFSPLVMQRDGFQAYQLVTSLFQHVDLLHLFGNMLFLFVFGNAVNAKLGHVGFLAAYIGIGIVEGLLSLVLIPASAWLGASAAIMGICGMFLVLYPRNDVRVLWEFESALMPRGWTGEIPGWAVVLLFLACDIWGAIVRRDAGIAYVSHIIGGVAGIGLAVVLLKAQWVAPDRGEQTLLQCLAGEGPTEETPRRRRKRPRKEVT